MSDSLESEVEFLKKLRADELTQSCEERLKLESQLAALREELAVKNKEIDELKYLLADTESVRDSAMQAIYKMNEQRNRTIQILEQIQNPATTALSAQELAGQALSTTEGEKE